MMLLSIFNGVLCASVIWGIMVYLASRVNHFRLRQRADQDSLNDYLRPLAGVETDVPTVAGRFVKAYHRGSGPTLVLLPTPGYDLRQQNLLWDQLAAKGFRLITFEARPQAAEGAGPENRIDSRWVQDLQAILLHFQVTEALLLSQGIGTSLLLQALRTPDFPSDRLRGVISLGGSVGDQLFRAPYYHFMRSLVLGSWFPYFVRHRPFASWLGATFWGKDPSYNQIQAGLQTIHPSVVQAVAQGLPQPGVDAAPITLPALLVHGTHDQVIAPANLRALSRQFEAAHQVLVPEMGHLMGWEAAPKVAEWVYLMETERLEEA